MPTANSKTSSRFGTLLKEWRRLRGKSQLDLALDADVSTRHISFIESGRAAPSKEMILTLASALNVPLREQNVLLTAAGFSAYYQESNLDSVELTESKRALDLILSKHEPYPAVVMNRNWDILSTNTGANTFFSFLVGSDAPQDKTPNVLRMMFHSDLARKYVINWIDVARSLVSRVYREALGGVPDSTTLSVLSEVLGYKDVPENLRAPDLTQPLTPFVPVIFEKQKKRFHFSSLVTTLGTPQDITLQEIRIECFYPMDEETENNVGVLRI